VTLTHDNYHSIEADQEYMSWHQLLAWRKCPRAELERQRGTWVAPDKECYIIGRYVETAILTPDLFPEFVKQHSGWIMTGKKERAAFVRASQMVDRIKRDSMAVDLLTRGEHQVILTGEIGGLPWRGMVDVLHPEAGFVVDLKTADDFDPVWESVTDPDSGFRRNRQFAWYSRYWGQLAVYQELARQNYPLNGGFDCIIVGVSKEDPPGLQALQLGSSERLYRELIAAVNAVAVFQEYKIGAEEAPACGRCAWCRANMPMEVVPVAE